MFSVEDWSFEEALDGYSSWSHCSQQRTVTQFSAHSHWRPWTFWLCPTCLLRLIECITKTSSGRSFPGLPQPSSSPPSNYAGRTGPATSGETIKQPCLLIHFWEFVSYQLMAALTLCLWCRCTSGLTQLSSGASGLFVLSTLPARLYLELSHHYQQL